MISVKPRKFLEEYVEKLKQKNYRERVSWEQKRRTQEQYIHMVFISYDLLWSLPLKGSKPEELKAKKQGYLEVIRDGKRTP